MTTPANLRSVAIRVTGVSAALAISFLAASTRAEVVTHRALNQSSAGSLSHLEPASSAGSRAEVSLAISEALSSGGIDGYFAGPRHVAFSGSILTHAAAPASLLTDHKSDLAHLSGVVLRSQR